MAGYDIRFPHLGIEIEHLGKGVSVFGYTIAYYGMIVAFGMVMGFLVARWQAKRTGQDTELYLDLTLCDIVFAVIGARIYYVIFQWDYYKDNPIQIFNLRAGGLAIYGGIIAGVLTTFVFAKVRKVSFLQLVDTACMGLVTGQMIGRWGNFCNREAFGGYTDNILAMQLRRGDVMDSYITREISDHLVTMDGVEYIQVHPTFLYESLWNLVLLVILILAARHKKYNGQIFLLYLAGYGMGRLWVEGLRTDQLLLWGTKIPVSQALSAGVAAFAVLLLLYHEVRRHTKTQEPAA